MISERSNWPILATFKRKYACRGKSTLTPLVHKQRAAGPNRAVQRGKFVVFNGDHRAKILAEQVRVLAQALFNAQEESRPVLKAVPGCCGKPSRIRTAAPTPRQELTLGFRNTQLVKSLFLIESGHRPGFAAGGFGRLTYKDFIQLEARDIRAQVGMGR